METKRTATNYALTRKQKRYIARLNMEKEGWKNFCKHSYNTRYYHNKPIGTYRIESPFASHWKEYVEVK